MKVYIDIETIPTQNHDFQAYVCETLKAPANYKDPEKLVLGWKKAEWKP